MAVRGGPVRVSTARERTRGRVLIVGRVAGVPVVNTYVPQGTDPSSEKSRTAPLVRAALGLLRQTFFARRSACLDGDFNVAPDVDRRARSDAAARSGGVSSRRTSGARACKGLGLRRCFPDVPPGAGELHVLGYYGCGTPSRAALDGVVDHYLGDRFAC